jgi:hypothetical protein
VKGASRTGKPIVNTDITITIGVTAQQTELEIQTVTDTTTRTMMIKPKMATDISDHATRKMRNATNVTFEKDAIGATIARNENRATT